MSQNAINMYLAGIQQERARQAEFTRLASTATGQAQAMYQAAASQHAARAADLDRNMNILQNPSWVPPTQANILQSQQQLAEIGVREQRAKQDTGLTMKRMTDEYNQEIVPQLRGALGATGQFYGTAGQKAEQGAARDFTNRSFDVQQALQRQLDDFTRQRTYASIGTLV